MNPTGYRYRVLERPLPLIVLGILILFTYARFFQIPYVGFDFNATTGEVVEVFVVPETGESLSIGDKLIRIDTLSWSDYRANPRLTFFKDFRTGQPVSLEIQRDGQEIAIRWTIPGLNYPEFLDRLLNSWLLGYIFWLFGTVALLVFRPRSVRRGLFVAFHYLTAFWLVVGSISMWQIWHSAILLRMAIWICVPLYLHFHWNFPEPLTHLPKLVPWSMYLIGFGLTVAEWFTLLSRETYFWGFLAATGGSIILLVLHFILQPAQRRAIRLLVFAGVLAIIPIIGVGIAGALSQIPQLGGGALLALPILPVTYFYAIYRHQLGGLGARINRIVSVYVYFILLGTVLVVIVPLADAALKFPGATSSIGILAALLTGFLTIYGFPYFIRWFERRLLGIPLAPTHLLEIYTDRIATSLDHQSLVHLLRDELLPSMLVRQSVLLQMDTNSLKPFVTIGMDDSEIPAEGDIPELMTRAGRFLGSAHVRIEPFNWILLILPLQVSGETMGLWLFGRRDPDDFYAEPEISILKTIANQTAIALRNIEQAEHLHLLYQSNIDWHEEERSALARELHDDVLGQLAVLSTQTTSTDSPKFQDLYQQVIAHLRQILQDLRPAMLNFGLSSAIEECVDELPERFGSQVAIILDVPPSDVRYDPKVEEHLYRIVQQACENAFRHAQAAHIRIQGSLEPDRVHLTVEDDGTGFELADLGFETLLVEKHFGLAGMIERAAIIEAELKFASELGQGTRVSLNWTSGGAPRQE